MLRRCSHFVFHFSNSTVRSLPAFDGGVHFVFKCLENLDPLQDLEGELHWKRRYGLRKNNVTLTRMWPRECPHFIKIKASWCKIILKLFVIEERRGQVLGRLIFEWHFHRVAKHGWFHQRTCCCTQQMQGHLHM